ncbi:MAG: putative phage holin [Blastococcus sp.]
MRWTFYLYAVTALPWACCLLAYGLRSPWRRSGVGRAMFTTYGSLTAVLTLAAILRIVHLPYDVALALALITLAAVCVAGVVQLVLILGAQRRR